MFPATALGKASPRLNDLARLARPEHCFNFHGTGQGWLSYVPAEGASLTRPSTP